MLHQTSPVLCTSALLVPLAPKATGGPTGRAVPFWMWRNVSGFLLKSVEYG